MKQWITRFGPGILLSAALAAIAMLLQAAEVLVVGQPIIEGLVIAILLGMLVRTAWRMNERWLPGVSFSARQVLEFAIVLLGVSINLPALLKAGPAMLLAIALVVVTGILASMQIGRLFGLNSKLAILVACGNSICGNSAIAAVAPVIGADKKDIASSIALTAVIGVAMVLALPLLISVASLSLYQYGVLAGMTVYAMPQVVAATFPVSALSGEVGTLVKLVRILLLGPVVLFFALRYRGTSSPSPAPVVPPGRSAIPVNGHAAARANPLAHSLTRFVPWFIIGFVILAVARSLGVLPGAIADPLREVSRSLTVVAMAALGLGVDIRVVRQVGRPVALAVIGSLLVLLMLSLTLIKVFGITG